MDGLLQSYRATFGFRSYEHQELEGTTVGTTFDNQTVEGELLLSHRKVGALRRQRRRLVLESPVRVDRCRSAVPAGRSEQRAAFMYEEVTWPHATLQFGGRLDRTSYRRRSRLPARDFTECVRIGRGC